MIYQIGTQYEPCTLVVHIRSLKPCTLHLQAYDRDRMNTVFTNRFKNCVMPGDLEFHIQMPLSGKMTLVKIFDEQFPDRAKEYETSFEVLSIEKKGLRTRKDVVDDSLQLRQFMDLAERFCFNAGELAINGPDEAYTSKDKYFKIQYQTVLLDENTNNPHPTPARINRHTGVMQGSKEKLAPITVPGRMVIFTHEYSHLWMNDTPENELEADLNGLTLYLSWGWPRIEAIETYSKTFYNSPSDDNMNRMKHIENFILNFDNEFFK